MNKSEPLLNRRESKNDVESRGNAPRYDKACGHLITEQVGVRRGDGIILVRASVRNTGTFRSDAKGEAQVAKTARARVPMRNEGSEQLIVVMKRSNFRGAKGLRYSGLPEGQLPKAGGTYGTV